MSDTYTMTVTATQAAVISRACELLGRLGIGQWPEFIHCLPGDAADQHAYELEEDLRPIMAAWFARYPIGTRQTVINGWQSCLGVGNPDAAPDTDVAFDLHRVIRHRLAWDRATAKGITDGKTRNWSEMLGVYFDEPMRYGTEPLAKMEKTT